MRRLKKMRPKVKVTKVRQKAYQLKTVWKCDPKRHSDPALPLTGVLISHGKSCFWTVGPIFWPALRAERF